MARKDLSERRERLGKVASGVLHESRPIFFFFLALLLFLVYSNVSSVSRARFAAFNESQVRETKYIF